MKPKSTNQRESKQTLSHQRYLRCRWRLGLLLLSGIPPFLALAFISIYGVNVPRWDQWEFVGTLEKAYAGALTVSDLFAQHNEHRVLAPRLVMLAMAITFDYNTIYEMYFGWSLLTLSGLVVFKKYLQTYGWSNSALLRFAPISGLLFSWGQYENFLWGWQITFFMTVFAVVTTHYLLDSSHTFDNPFVFALGTTVIAAFSNANGILVWPIGLLQIGTPTQT